MSNLDPINRQPPRAQHNGGSDPPQLTTQEAGPAVPLGGMDYVLSIGILLTLIALAGVFLAIN